MEDNLGFGDVFLYQGNYYVYFAEAVEDSIVYAGKILQEAHSILLDQKAKAAVKRGPNLRMRLCLAMLSCPHKSLGI